MKRKPQRRYRFDYADADHFALLGIVKSLPCSVMASGYPSRLCDERPACWRSLELQVYNQSCIVAEKMWFNFEPDWVHWSALSALARRDFTHRRIVKRKSASWSRRYAAMPRAEPLAVIAALTRRNSTASLRNNRMPISMRPEWRR